MSCKSPNPPPLFRGLDWLAMLLAFAVVLIVYLLTLAPELTLEDSGELCTGAFYAGIPHPPGYPFWSIYAWLWTELLPFGNVAWRVEVGEATAAAFGCALVALMVSRGSSMLIEGIEELKSISWKSETGICLICGVSAGVLLGLGGVMWSESVAINRISLFGVPWVMLVMLCLLRWIYAPHQRRYLCIGLFFFGLCATIHQTLLVAAMGIEIAIVYVQPKLGREVMLWNCILYMAGMITESTGLITLLNTATMVLVIFHTVGIVSIMAYVWLSIVTKESLPEYVRDAALFAAVCLLASIPAVGTVAFILALLALIIFASSVWLTRTKGWDWLLVIVLGLLWLAGASFYFYEAIAGMTNPPMEWGYPRTVEGFFHALSRGQYEKANPSPIFSDPTHFLLQIGMLLSDIVGEFNWLCLFVALIPLFFLRRMQKRERAWIISLVSVYAFIGGLLLVLMNPQPDKQSADLSRVFFTSSHAVIAILLGYGFALTAAYLATHYVNIRRAGMMLGAAAAVPALISLYEGISESFYGGLGYLPYDTVLLLFILIGAALVLTGLCARKLATANSPDAATRERDLVFAKGFGAGAAMLLLTSLALVLSRKDSLGVSQILHGLGRLFAPQQYSLAAISGVLLLLVALGFIAAIAKRADRAPIGLALALIALIPITSGLAHWARSEQRNHWFGYWFGHDMFTPPFNGKDGKPLYPEMTRNAILFGGTDPGRFCPTYMIFCDSFIPGKCLPAADRNFDRRDVYIITQNALADGTYQMYIRAQYNRSTQKDPPFFQELLTSQHDRDAHYTNALARAVIPLDRYFTRLGDRIEKRRRTYTSWFKPEHFTNLSGLASKLNAQQDPLSKYIYETLSPATRALLGAASPTRNLASSLAKDLNALLEKPLYTPERFQGVPISEYLSDFIRENPRSHTRIRLNRLLLEAAYPHEIATSVGGVYPDREIYFATPDDSARCFQDYLNDANRRLQHDLTFPNEPKQIKPGEDVHAVGEGTQQRVQVSGQVAVMAINANITKVIFDHNPKNEFFVEESYPLDWMYPYLAPFGIIMKINREKLPELTQDIVDRDHDFWKQFSKRLTGDFIDYDTSVKEIADWVEKTYLHKDFRGFTGDRAFVRDEQAQKAFSKLRSSIGGVYTYRITAPETKNGIVQQRMIREAEFAFKQAFAFCPYSPEAVFRYANVLSSLRRFDDAILVAETCLKFDPYNGSVKDLINSVKRMKQTQMAIGGPAEQAGLSQLEEAARKDPSNFQAAFNLASAYVSAQQNARAITELERVMNHPASSPAAWRSLSQAFAELEHTNGLKALAGKYSAWLETHSADYEARLGASENYRRMRQNPLAVLVLEPILQTPQSNPDAYRYAAHEFNQLQDYEKLQQALEKYAHAVPASAEAWYELSGLDAMLGKQKQAIDALKIAADVCNARRKTNAATPDPIAMARQDPKFAALKTNKDFIELTK